MESICLASGSWQRRLSVVKWLLELEGGASIAETTIANIMNLPCCWQLAEGLTLDAGSRAVTEMNEFGCSQRRLSVVQWLLTEGGALITEKHNNSDSALVLAAKGEHLSTVQWLLAELEGGASITGTRIWLNMLDELEHKIRLLRTLSLYQAPPESVSAGWCPARVNFLLQAAR